MSVSVNVSVYGMARSSSLDRWSGTAAAARGQSMHMMSASSDDDLTVCDAVNARHDVFSNHTACVVKVMSPVMNPAVSLAVIGRPGLHGRHVTAAVGQEYSTVTGGLTDL